MTLTDLRPMRADDPRPCACIRCTDPCGPALDHDALCEPCRAARTAGERCPHRQEAADG